jgi:hypothetical protein
MRTCAAMRRWHETWIPGDRQKQTVDGKGADLRIGGTPASRATPPASV